MTNSIEDVLFTSAVRAAQTRYGSRVAIARLEAQGRWKSELSEDIISFISARDSFYLGTASRQGRPYIQHRGGPPGFIRVPDNKTLMWPEYSGNRQYISTGNLSENDQAFIFLMDYVEQRRIKLWGRATVIEGIDTFICPLDNSLPNAQEAEFKRGIRFDVEAWDENCRQHITPRHTEPQLMDCIKRAKEVMERLEAELLKRQTSASINANGRSTRSANDDLVLTVDQACAWRIRNYRLKTIT